MSFEYKQGQISYEDADHEIDFSQLLGVIEDPENNILEHDYFIDFIGMSSEQLGRLTLSWLEQAYGFENEELELLYKTYDWFAKPLIVSKV